MAPLEPWERVYVSPEYLDSDHGHIECTWCHAGNPDADDKQTAHAGIQPLPSEEAGVVCASCHDQERYYATSIHTTQEGYYERFRVRAGFDLRDAGNEHALEEFKGECGKCHATCGQCHVSRPVTVGSGLNWAHEFKKTPDMKTNCTACHGSRIGEEYLGEHEGLTADVHYIPNLMKCEACHDSHEMHGGDGTKLSYRYDEDNAYMPRCEDCHDAAGVNTYHATHWEGTSGVTLACQVCHAQAYKNCNGCHVGGSGITGSSYLSFEIGRNYLQDNARYSDYDYITVRHIPIAPNTYAPWGIDDLPNFEQSEPTWKMATPHNIKRFTPQTTVAEGQSCSASCHNSDLYLRSGDIDDYEDANYNATTGASGYGYDDIERERLANSEVIIPE